MPDISWVDILRDFGLPVSLVIFFVWQGKAREDRIEKRQSDLESFARTQLVELWRVANSTITENTKVMARLETWLEDSVSARRSGKEPR